jgi:hypothetical protein
MQTHTASAALGSVIVIHRRGLFGIADRSRRAFGRGNGDAVLRTRRT